MGRGLLYSRMGGHYYIIEKNKKNNRKCFLTTPAIKLVLMSKSKKEFSVVNFIAGTSLLRAGQLL